MKSKVYEIENIEDIASWVIEQAKDERIWTFRGEMGAGKTTLIKVLAKKMGVIDTVSSPTFGLVNQYERADGFAVYHFDFYRLEDPMEALDIGIEEYFYSGNYCWIEWPEMIGAYLPEQFFSIKIDYLSPENREITLEHFQNA